MLAQLLNDLSDDRRREAWSLSGSGLASQIAGNSIDQSRQ